jgi:hypothetical protein
LDLQKSLVNIVGMMVVDILLLVSMLIGLLQYAHRSSTGIWPLLYQQVPFPLQYFALDADIPKCIIWIALAAAAEVPFVVNLFLWLDDTVIMMSVFLQVFIILSLNGVYLSTHVKESG